MILKEIVFNLFEVSEEYYLAHCISEDYEMGAGIAVTFNAKFNLKDAFRKIDWESNGKLTYPTCVKIGRVLNLITKEKYWHKPTYYTFEDALIAMRDIVLSEGIKKIATYRLGCTRDKLQWPKVKEIIEKTFKDVDVEIMICLQ